MDRRDRGGGDYRRDDRRDRRGGSPPRRRHRSRSRDRRRDGSGRGSYQTSAEDQQRLRDMLLSEAAKKNPEVASVLQSDLTDRDALQRTLATVTAQTAAQAPQSYGFGGNDPNRHSRFGNRPQKPNESDRVFLELHVGSLPDQMMDEHELVRFLNQQFHQRSLTTEPGDPVLSARVNQSGRYAFVLLRSKEETTRGLQLAGTQCFGNTLRVDRPKGYIQRFGGGNANIPMDEGQLLNQALQAAPLPPVLPGISREELKRKLEESVSRYGDPTSVVQLSNLAGASVQDVEQEIKKYGVVVGIRQSEDGFIVKMGSIQDAEKLVQLKRMYGGNVVKATFRPLTEWTKID